MKKKSSSAQSSNSLTLKGIFSTFAGAILAGVAISLGGLVFLKVKDLFPGANVVGALLFAVGLFCVCSRGYALYTGKVCYLFQNKPSYLIELAVIWIGNLLGCMLAGGLLNLTSLCGAEGINATAAAMCESKIANSPLSLFILGFFCDIFIYIAVNGYAKNPHEFGKYLAILFGVVCFIVAGTEHSVADMFYFCVSGTLYAQPGKAFFVLLMVTLGNSVGGVFLPLLEALRDKLAKK